MDFSVFIQNYTWLNSIWVEEARGGREADEGITQHPPLGMALQGRADNTSASREGEGQDGYEPRYDDWCIEHFIFLTEIYQIPILYF